MTNKYYQKSKEKLQKNLSEEEKDKRRKNSPE